METPNSALRSSISSLVIKERTCDPEGPTLSFSDLEQTNRAVQKQPESVQNLTAENNLLTLVAGQYAQRPHV